MDKYDEALAHLKEHPGQIPIYWMAAKPPFQFLSKTEHISSFRGMMAGCPSMVKRGGHTSESPALTKMVEGSNIPTYNERSITVADLPEFIRIQREADRLLGRVL